MSVLVTGSLAFDINFKFPGVFSDELKSANLDHPSLSFFTPSFVSNFGGCAGNIAYNLALLNVPHVLAGTIGHDSSEYIKHLQDNNVNTSFLQISPEATARCVLFSDRVGAQINSFFPGAMSTPYDRKEVPFDVADINLVIIAPNDPHEMIQWSQFAAEHEIPSIFDAGQAIHGLNHNQLSAGINLAEYLIFNKSEHELAVKKLGWDPRETGKPVIITDSSRGSIIYHKNEAEHIPASPIKELVDPTGAGDAYRAGLIQGILNGNLVEGCYVGSDLAAIKVQTAGSQLHKLS